MAADTPQTDVAYHARRRHEILKGKVYSSESESDVRQAVLALYDLDLVGNLEKHRIDFWSDELLIEFKYDADLRKLDVKCKVLAQLLHYLYLMPTKHGKFMLPENIGLVDKNNFVLYRTEDFIPYLLRDSYFTNVARPSAEHPELERMLKHDPKCRGIMFHTIADYQEVWGELEKRGVYK